MKIHKRILSLAAVAAASLVATFAYPATPPPASGGLYITPDSTGASWKVTLISFGDAESFSGVFEATTSINSLQRSGLESSDSAVLSAPNKLTFVMKVQSGGRDTVSFKVANGGGLCLRDSTDVQSSIYLGDTSHATTISTPSDLTHTNSCGFSPPGITHGLFLIPGPTDGTWKATLVSDGGLESFSGYFQTSHSINSVQLSSLEGSDSAVLVAPDKLTIDLKVWSGGHDDVSFIVAGGGTLCLWDNGSTQSDVYIGDPNNTIKTQTPADLTYNNACGPAVPPPPPPPPVPRRYHPGQYVEFYESDDSQATMAKSITAGVTGFIKRYKWAELEPTEGNYDFSQVASDLQYVASQGLQLIVLVVDKTFKGEWPTPQYLRADTYTRANRAGGYTAIRWNPFMVTREKALFAALGAQFDSSPAFEGLATQETSPSLDKPALDATGYTPEKYRDALIEWLGAAGDATPHAHVFWFMNFLPGGQKYLADIGKTTAPHGVVGGPDVMPDNFSLVTKVYPVYDLLKGIVPLFARVEAVCYHHEHADKAAYPTKFWTPLEQFNYAKTRLAANYMFWVRVPNPPAIGAYDYFDTLKVMADNPVWSPSL